MAQLYFMTANIFVLRLLLDCLQSVCLLFVSLNNTEGITQRALSRFFKGFNEQRQDNNNTQGSFLVLQLLLML